MSHVDWTLGIPSTGYQTITSGSGFVVYLPPSVQNGMIWNDTSVPPLVNGSGNIILYAQQNMSGQYTGVIGSDPSVFPGSSMTAVPLLTNGSANSIPGLDGVSTANSTFGPYYALTYTDQNAGFLPSTYGNSTTIASSGVLGTNNSGQNIGPASAPVIANAIAAMESAAIIAAEKLAASQADRNPLVGACFSAQTFIKLLPLITKSKHPAHPIHISRSPRNDKPMYRCEYPPYGKLEFTDDHQFYYRNKLYKFRRLIQIHPILKITATPIPLDDPECGASSMIFNVYNHPNAYAASNLFALSNGLLIMGGHINKGIVAYHKKYYVLKTLLEKANSSKDVKSSLAKYFERHSFGNIMHYIDTASEWYNTYSELEFFV